MPCLLADVSCRREGVSKMAADQDGRDDLHDAYCRRDASLGLCIYLSFFISFAIPQDFTRTMYVDRARKRYVFGGLQ